MDEFSRVEVNQVSAKNLSLTLAFGEISADITRQGDDDVYEFKAGGHALVIRGTSFVINYRGETPVFYMVKGSGYLDGVLLVEGNVATTVGNEIVITPIIDPTAEPTAEPTLTPTVEPTLIPTVEPTLMPTVTPTVIPTVAPTLAPTPMPTVAPTPIPTVEPTPEPPNNTIHYPDGSIYVGDIVNGAPHGRGVMVWANDTARRYEGYWQNGLLHGQGTLVWTNGHYYVGEFRNGLCHGWGKYTAPGEYDIEGMWEYGHPVLSEPPPPDLSPLNLSDGFHRYENKYFNMVYEGNWVNGLPNGFGTLTGEGQTKEGDYVKNVWVGNFTDGLLNGTITHTNTFIDNVNIFTTEFYMGWRVENGAPMYELDYIWGVPPWGHRSLSD
jgi:hypothetical protein